MAYFKHSISNNTLSHSVAVLVFIITSVVIIILCMLDTVTIPPFRALGGAIWFNHGSHYINDTEISQRMEKINAPIEARLINEISQSTQACDLIEVGFCQQAPKAFVDKVLITPAITYQPGTPDTKKVVGYCTLCNDGTFSPSCAVGRGACSYHSGVNAYNVAKYITIRGVAEVAARSAVYSYVPRSYMDSQSYSKPMSPSLSNVVDFTN